MKMDIRRVTVILSLSVMASCSIGTAKEACKNNLRKIDFFGSSVENCDFALVASQISPEQSILTPSEFESRKAAGVNYFLLNCYQYYEKLQECNKEEKKYLPAIYSKE